MGKKPPTVLPPLWGWGRQFQEPVDVSIRPNIQMVSLRVAGLIVGLAKLSTEHTHYVIVLTTPFSKQLSQHHIWWEMWFGVGIHWAKLTALQDYQPGLVRDSGTSKKDGDWHEDGCKLQTILPPLTLEEISWLPQNDISDEVKTFSTYNERNHGNRLIIRHVYRLLWNFNASYLGGNVDDWLENLVSTTSRETQSVSQLF
jgi:hypothetical protein